MASVRSRRRRRRGRRRRQVPSEYSMSFLVRVGGENCDVMAVCSDDWLPMYVSSSTKRLEVRRGAGAGSAPLC